MHEGSLCSGDPKIEGKGALVLCPTDEGTCGPREITLVDAQTKDYSFMKKSNPDSFCIYQIKDLPISLNKFVLASGMKFQKNLICLKILYFIF